MKKIIQIQIMLLITYSAFSQSILDSYIINGENYKYLDANNVRAGFGNRGAQFWDYNGSATFEVPKGSGKTTMFCSGIWMGGINDYDSLCVAGVRYNQDGYDFWPGPISVYYPSLMADSNVAHQFDKIWEIDRSTIDDFIYNFNSGNVANGTYTVPESISQWPAMFENASGNSEYLAPFIDVDGDGYYDPMHGDYPQIKGDQMLWWIFNDLLSNHTETGGKKLGIEVWAKAYAFDSQNPAVLANPDLDNVIFVDYTVINRSTYTYHDAYIGMFADFDIGDASDDYIGCNVGLNTIYGYNADSIDGVGQVYTYGENPPVQTMTVLDGMYADDIDGIDNDRDSVTDEMFENFGLSRFISFSNPPYGTVATQDPHTAVEHYNNLLGKWKDGTNLFYGGTGYVSDSNTTDIAAQFMFPGNSDPNGWGTGVAMAPWSEVTEGNTPGDRRGLGSMGPFNFWPGRFVNFTVMYSYFRDSSYQETLQNFPQQLSEVIDWYYQNSSNDMMGNTVSFPVFNNKTVLVYPNPATDFVKIECDNLSDNAFYTISEISGRIVCSGKINQNGNTTIDVRSLTKGIYIISVSGGETKKCFRLVKI